MHSRKRAVSHRVGWLASGSPPYDGINSDRTRGTPMEKPVVAQKAPFAVTLSPGEYYWCACGRSKAQPMCDGSHQGTGLTPVTFTLKIGNSDGVIRSTTSIVSAGSDDLTSSVEEHEAGAGGALVDGGSEFLAHDVLSLRVVAMVTS